MLGLIGKFVNEAMGSIRDDFEAWLAGICEIEQKAEGGAAGAGMQTAGGTSMGQLGGLAVALMSGFRRANETFENAAESIRHLGRQQAQQAELLNRTVAQLERFAEKEKQIIEALDRTELLRHEMAQAGRRRARSRRRSSPASPTASRRLAPHRHGILRHARHAAQGDEPAGGGHTARRRSGRRAPRRLRQPVRRDRRTEEGTSRGFARRRGNATSGSGRFWRRSSPSPAPRPTAPPPQRPRPAPASRRLRRCSAARRRSARASRR